MHNLSCCCGMDFLEGIYQWNEDVKLYWCDSTNIVVADLVVITI
jgi:hypothetical protein